MEFHRAGRAGRLHRLENAHNVKERIMAENQHEKLAKEIKDLFAKEFVNRNGGRSY